MNNFSRRFAPAALAPLALILLGGCGNSTPAPPPVAPTGGPASVPANYPGNGPAKTGEVNRIAFVTNNPSDYWTIARKGTEKADAELADVTVDFEMPAGGTAAEQKTIVDNMLAKGVKGIAISPVAPDDQTQMLNDAAAKIPVITQDSDAAKSNRVCYIGTDNEKAGEQAGELMKKALPGGGKIMLFVGKADAQNAKDRSDGIKKALQGSNIQIIDTKTDDTDRVRAVANVSDALVKYPDLAGAMGLWSYNGPAILNAVTTANKVGKVKIVCFDEEKETLAGVKAGSIDATVVQQPYEFGYQAVKMLDALIKGDKNGVPANKMVIVDTIAVDKAGVDAYMAKMKVLRGEK